MGFEWTDRHQYDRSLLASCNHLQICSAVKDFKIGEQRWSHSSQSTDYLDNYDNRENSSNITDSYFVWKSMVVRVPSLHCTSVETCSTASVTQHRVYGCTPKLQGGIQQVSYEFRPETESHPAINISDCYGHYLGRRK